VDNNCPTSRRTSTGWSTRPTPAASKTTSTRWCHWGSHHAGPPALEEEDAAALDEDTAALEEDAAALDEDTAALDEDTAALDEDTAALEEEPAVLEEDNGTLNDDDTPALDDGGTAALDDDAEALAELDTPPLLLPVDAGNDEDPPELVPPEEPTRDDGGAPLLVAAPEVTARLEEPAWLLAPPVEDPAPDPAPPLDDAGASLRVTHPPASHRCCASQSASVSQGLCGTGGRQPQPHNTHAAAVTRRPWTRITAGVSTPCGRDACPTCNTPAHKHGR
jgi:hypothetical protein